MSGPPKARRRKNGTIQLREEHGMSTRPHPILRRKGRPWTRPDTSKRSSTSLASTKKLNVDPVGDEEANMLAVPADVEERFTFDDIKNASLPRRSECSLARFLPTLSSKERRTVRAAIIDPSVTAAAVHKVLRRVGFMNSRFVIERHRRDRCGQCGLGPPTV